MIITGVGGSISSILSRKLRRIWIEYLYDYEKHTGFEVASGAGSGIWGVHLLAFLGGYIHGRAMVGKWLGLGYLSPQYFIYDRNLKTYRKTPLYDRWVGNCSLVLITRRVTQSRRKLGEISHVEEIGTEQRDRLVRVPTLLSISKNLTLFEAQRYYSQPPYAKVAKRESVGFSSEVASVILGFGSSPLPLDSSYLAIWSTSTRVICNSTYGIPYSLTSFFVEPPPLPPGLR